jgi:hypothetical protein
LLDRVIREQSPQSQYRSCFLKSAGLRLMRDLLIFPLLVVVLRVNAELSERRPAINRIRLKN